MFFFFYTYPPTAYSLSGTGNYASVRALVPAPNCESRRKRDGVCDILE